MQTFPTYGISSQFEIDLDARLPEDPLTFVTDASKAGLYTQFFLRNGSLWARVAGPLDLITDFQTTL
jgi:hypothetical protein